MADISLDLRRRIVEAYHSGRTATYEATASMFDVGVATVNRLLRRQRETGDVMPKPRDRKSTRLNSSHSQISYAVFCLKKKKKTTTIRLVTPYTTNITIQTARSISTQ